MITSMIATFQGKGGNHPCERRAESGEQRADFGEQKFDILLINL